MKTWKAYIKSKYINIYKIFLKMTKPNILKIKYKINYKDLWWIDIQYEEIKIIT
jgi:hypothetical protein